MDFEIEVGSQVEWRRPVKNGTLVEIGNVVRINAASQTALIDFPQLYKMQNVPLAELTNTRKSFGPYKVQASPAQRTLNRLIQ